MAHKKAGSSTVNGRDSNPKMLGIKCFGGEHVTAGSIIVRQRGTVVHPGKFIGKGKDDTLFAMKSGSVRYSRFSGDKKRVEIVPS
jgi:large subunit ribosomal protein L27